MLLLSWRQFAYLGKWSKLIIVIVSYLLEGGVKELIHNSIMWVFTGSPIFFLFVTKRKSFKIYVDYNVEMYQMCRALEQEFQRQSVDKSHHDSLAHVLGVMGGIANLLEIWGKVPAPVLVLQCFATFVFSPFNVYLCCFNPKRYAKCRTQSVLSLWLLSFTLMYFYQTHDRGTWMLGVQSDGATMWVVMRTSPVAFINAVALNLPLAFPLHICVNCAAMVGLGLWAVMFCSENMSLGVRGDSCCVMRVMVCMFALAFIVPSTVLYCKELNARGNFLHRRLRQDERQLASWLTWELQMSAMATGLSVLLKAWLWTLGAPWAWLHTGSWL